MKTRLNALPLRLKLTFLMFAISLVTLAIATSWLSYNQLRALKDSAVTNTQSKATLIAASIESALVFNDDRSALKSIKILEQDNNIDVAKVFLADKTLLAQVNKISDDNYPINFDRSVLLTDNSLDIMHPVKIREQTIGWVFLKSNLLNLKRQQQNYYFILLVLIAVSSAIAWILSRYLQGIITHPIKTMVKHLEGIYKNNNYEKRLEMQREDELGSLVEGFNHMLAAVQDREEELQKHGDHLQRLVNIRTEQLYQKAHFDGLTALPNRYLLLDRLTQAIASAHREKTTVVLLFLDLDRFKIVNDTLGHGVGDKLLVEVAQRLEKIGREGDTVARLGGDEFVFLLEHLDHPEDAARIAERIISNITPSFEIDGHLLHISTSIGIAVYPNDAENEDQLLKNADTSMYHAKEKGVGQYCFYQDQMNQTSFQRLKLENELRKAFDRNEFSLVYQPQIQIDNGEIVKLEALLRWKNKELGVISPGEFIPIAEEIGIIGQIGTWVLSEVCQQLSQWRAKNIAPIKISINVSASHIISTQFYNHLREVVESHKLPFNQLEIEITEDVFLDDTDRTLIALRKIKNLGVDIAIDDFGTGYSSLRYLREFPASTLKLDGTFIKDIETSESSRGIIVSTILLAHSLDLVIVAECVEDAIQLQFLVEHRCDLVQGYYYYPPLAVINLETLLAKA